MTEPIAITVKRHKCPCCGKSYANKGSAVAHIGRCWHNPTARGCKTCKHYERGEDGDWTIGDPGSPEFCALDVSLDGSAVCDHCSGMGEIGSGDISLGTVAASCCPVCGGDGGTDGPVRKPGPIVHCDLWEAS